MMCWPTFTCRPSACSDSREISSSTCWNVAEAGATKPTVSPGFSRGGLIVVVAWTAEAEAARVSVSARSDIVAATSGWSGFWIALRKASSCRKRSID